MSERTEAPTPRRLEEARAEGNIPRSHELSTAVVLLVGVWLLQGLGKNLVQALEALMRSAVTAQLPGEIDSGWPVNLLVRDGLLRVGPSVGMILAGLLLAGVAANLGQTGFVWAKKRLGIKFDRVNPLAGLKRIFSPQGLVELLKAVLKLLVVGWTAYSFLKARMPEMLALTGMSFLDAVQHWTGLASGLAMRVAAAYLVLAAADYGYQRWQFMKKMRMTKQEVKEELKQSEGDPFIRSRIKGQQRRMARSRMMAKVPKADVVITNPTHLAVAIQYSPQEMRAPKVVAKGAHRVAERIVALARANQVPVVQNIPVARALYRTVEIDSEIPPELYIAMAEVLAYVYKIRGRTAASAANLA